MSGTHCLPLHTEGKFSRDKLIHIIRGQEGAEQHEGFAKANTSECAMNLRNPNSAKVISPATYRFYVALPWLRWAAMMKTTAHIVLILSLPKVHFFTTYLYISGVSLLLWTGGQFVNSHHTGKTTRTWTELVIQCIRCFLLMVKLGEQNHPLNLSICPVFSPQWNPWISVSELTWQQPCSCLFCWLDKSLLIFETVVVTKSFINCDLNTVILMMILGPFVSLPSVSCSTFLL